MKMGRLHQHLMKESTWIDVKTVCDSKQFWHFVNKKQKKNTSAIWNFQCLDVLYSLCSSLAFLCVKNVFLYIQASKSVPQIIKQMTLWSHPPPFSVNCLLNDYSVFLQEESDGITIMIKDLY